MLLFHHGRDAGTLLRRGAGGATSKADGAASLLWSAQVADPGVVAVLVVNFGESPVDLPAGKLRLMVVSGEPIGTAHLP